MYPKHFSFNPSLVLHYKYLLHHLCFFFFFQMFHSQLLQQLLTYCNWEDPTVNHIYSFFRVFILCVHVHVITFWPMYKYVLSHFATCTNSHSECCLASHCPVILHNMYSYFTEFYFVPCMPLWMFHRVLFWKKPSGDRVWWGYIHFVSILFFFLYFIASAVQPHLWLWNVHIW